MHFTYEKSEKVYKLRNKMNSTVKTMDEVAVIYNQDTGEIKEYGSTSEMNKRHRNLAESGELQFEMFRSSELELEVFNKVINDEVSILAVIGDKTIAGKFYVSYYPSAWKPNIWGGKNDKPLKAQAQDSGEESKEDIATGDLVQWRMFGSSRQYTVLSEKTDDSGKKVFVLDYKGRSYEVPETELERIS
jgi:hypothetical protein